jgi:hypothetical protein
MAAVDLPRAIVLGGGVVASAGLCVAAMDAHPQGNIRRVVPFVFLTVAVWTVEVGILGGARRGAIVALTGAAVFMTVTALLVFIRPPLDYGDCQSVSRILWRETCRAQSELGWVAVLVIGATACGTVAVALGHGARRQIPTPEPTMGRPN